MEVADGGWLCFLETLAQKIGKEMMIAIVVALVVQWNEEKVALFQRGQQRLAVAAPGDCITEQALQPIQNRGLQQKFKEFWRQFLQHIFQQIIDQVAITAAKAGNKGFWIGLSLQGKSSQLQCCHPAFGALRQSSQCVGRKLQMHDITIKIGGFAIAKKEFVAGDFGQLIAHTQARQWQRGLGSAEYDQVQMGRGMVEQRLHKAIDLIIADEVIIIQNDEQWFVAIGERIEQHSSCQFCQIIAICHLRRAEDGVERLTQRVIDALQSGCQVAQKTYWIIVFGIERKPDIGRCAGFCCWIAEPIGNQRCLARTRGRRDQGERSRRATLKLFGQPRSGRLKGPRLTGGVYFT